VARALEGLPLIRAAFRRGEVSYSKVREMTRIAIPENEEALLMIARHGTAAHMQRLVRKYRRVEKLEAAAEAMAQYRRRYVHYSYDEDGMLVIEARLPSEIGEVVRKALDAAVEVLYRDGRRKRKEGERGEEQNEQCTDVEQLANGASAPDAEAGLTGAGVPAEASVVVPAETSPDVPAEAAADVPAEARTDVPAEASAGDAERLNAFSDNNQIDCVREEQWLPVIRPYAEKDDEKDLARFAAWLDGKPLATDDDDPSQLASAESESAEVAEMAETGETAEATHAEEAAEAAPQVPSAQQPVPSAARSVFLPIPTQHELPGGDSVVEEFEGEEWSESLGARRADALRLLAESFLARGA